MASTQPNLNPQPAGGLTPGRVQELLARRAASEVRMAEVVAREQSVSMREDAVAKLERQVQDEWRQMLHAYVRLERDRAKVSRMYVHVVVGCCLCCYCCAAASFVAPCNM